MDSVKRSSTEQQVHPGIHRFILHPQISSSDLLENALYLTEFFTLNPNHKLHLSTISLDSIEKDHDQFDLFLYDSLNDESSDDGEHLFNCSNNKNYIQTLVKERQLIEQLTRRCASLDSLDNYEHNSSNSSKILTHDLTIIRMDFNQHVRLTFFLQVPFILMCI